MTEEEYARLNVGDKVWLEDRLEIGGLPVYMGLPGTIVPSPHIWPPDCCRWAVVVSGRSFKFHYTPKLSSEFMQNISIYKEETENGEERTTTGAECG